LIQREVRIKPRAAVGVVGWQHFVPAAELHFLITCAPNFHEPALPLKFLHRHLHRSLLHRHRLWDVHLRLNFPGGQVLLPNMLHPIVHELRLHFHHPREACRVLDADIVQAPPGESFVHEQRRLELAILAFLLAELLLQLGDALEQEPFLVHHLLALLHLRHAPEFIEHACGLMEGGPHRGVLLLRPVQDQARLDVAERGELADLLYQTPPPLLEGDPPCGVIGNPCKFYLLPSHVAR
ncbi:unnamed protein product, partial [Musa banksii]